MFNFIHPGNSGKVIIIKKSFLSRDKEKADSAEIILYLLVSYRDLKMKGILVK